MSRLKVLVLYGGEAATNPRHELLAWLCGPTIDVDARVVAEAPPNTDGPVDDRVTAAMDWVDKAIAVVTPDERGSHEAPNIIDEIARWRERKGRATICILRQERVLGYSNHAGLVYVEFKSRVSEKFETLRAFVMDPLPAPSRPTMTPAAAAHSKDLLVVDSNPTMVLVEGRDFHAARIHENQERVTFTLSDLDGSRETALRKLAATRGRIHAVYGNSAIEGEVEDCSLSREAELGATLVLRLVERRFNSLSEVSLGGPRALSANDIATLRASRILFDDPPAAPLNTVTGMAEMFIRGGGEGSAEVTESSIPRLLQQLPRDLRSTWEAIRLLILQLNITNCVEHVELLRLHVSAGRLRRIEFRGQRPRQYSNQQPHIISLDREVDFWIRGRSYDALGRVASMLGSSPCRSSAASSRSRA